MAMHGERMNSIREAVISNQKRIPYELQELTEELRERARIELLEDEETKLQKLLDLRDLLNSQGIAFPDEDDFLLIFLRARKFDVKRAAALVKNMFTLIGKNDDIFGENLSLHSMQQTMKLNTFAFLPYRDWDGSALFVARPGKGKSEKAFVLEAVRAISIVLFQAVTLPPSQVAGIKMIMDFEDFSLSQLFNGIRYIGYYAEALMGCFPARFKDIHVVNEGVFAFSLWRLINILLSQKIKDRVHFHRSDGKCLRNFISPCLLPEEYGGELGSIENIGLADTTVISEGYIDKIKNFARLNRI